MGEHYNDKKALQLVHTLTEYVQYNLIKASATLAKEKGPCAYFDETKYSDGLMPIDTYKKDVDSIIDPIYHEDWEWLRELCC